MNGRRRTGESSLELLLDTICNTFGGVVFISMLVVMLVNMTSQAVTLAPPDRELQAELARFERELRETGAELGALRTARREQERIAEQVADAETRDRIRSLRGSHDRIAFLSEQYGETLSEIAAAQQEINQVAESLQTLDQALERARQALAASRRQLEAEITVRSRTAELPKLRPTDKQEVAFFLKEQRLCAYARRSDDGRLVPNPGEVVERQEADGQTFVEPNPSNGVLVRHSDEPQADLQAKLSSFDPQQHFLTVFVWPDSFGQFAALKQAMVRQGFEYRLVPFPADARVYLGRQSAPALVQ